VGENFTYSQSLIEMRNNGLVWTPETIDAFISDPENYIPANRMRLEGIKDPETRQLIINYLIRESQ
jgi:cytochrome c